MYISFLFAFATRKKNEKKKEEKKQGDQEIKQIQEKVTKEMKEKNLVYLHLSMYSFQTSKVKNQIISNTVH